MHKEDIVMLIKLKDGFILREIAGRIVVVPTGETLDLNLMISLNSTGRFLWERLEKGATAQELKDALMETYNVSEVLVQKDVDTFIAELEQNGFLE